MFQKIILWLEFINLQCYLYSITDTTSDLVYFALFFLKVFGNSTLSFSGFNRTILGCKQLSTILILIFLTLNNCVFSCLFVFYVCVCLFLSRTKPTKLYNCETAYCLLSRLHQNYQGNYYRITLCYILTRKCCKLKCPISFTKYYRYSHADWKSTDKSRLTCFKNILKISHSNYL